MEKFKANIKEWLALLTNQTIFLMAIGSVVANVFLVLVIYQIGMKYHVKPFFVAKYSNSDNLFDVLNLDLKNQKRRLEITDKLVREYVIRRLTFIRNEQLMKDQYEGERSRIKWASRQDIFDKLKAEVPNLNEVLGSGITKEAHIENVIYHGIVGKNELETRWEVWATQLIYNMKTGEKRIKPYKIKLNVMLNLSNRGALITRIIDRKDLEASFLFDYKIVSWEEEQ